MYLIPFLGREPIKKDEMKIKKTLHYYSSTKDEALFVEPTDIYRSID